ncbi:MAG: hypothetical protein ACFFCV_11830 [Promethearchaeota archaeon]
MVELIFELITFLIYGWFFGFLTGIFMTRPKNMKPEEVRYRFRFLGIIIADGIAALLPIIFSIVGIFGYSIGLVIGLFTGIYFRIWDNKKDNPILLRHQLQRKSS